MKQVGSPPELALHFCAVLYPPVSTPDWFLFPEEGKEGKINVFCLGELGAKGAT